MNKNGSESRFYRGKDIKAVRFGYNPNSSSLGVVVSALVYGTLTIAIVAPLVALGIRLIKKREDKN